jgi:protocatechuate 3,4-dioxygenase beta subunit
MHLFNRREFLASTAVAGAALFTTPGLFAEELMRTVPVGEGPFYPDKLPLDTDNDLLLINESITPAVGTIAHLSGRVLDIKGAPVRSAFVEIWQVDNNGAYLHSGSSNRQKWDANFQGYGRFLTDVRGQYYFRTIQPVDYPGRVPHIHVAVSQNGRRVCTTQLFIKGVKRNADDFLYRAIDPKKRATVEAAFEPIKGSKIGEVAANFDIVLGVTAEEPRAETLKGVAKPLSGRGPNRAKRR